LPGSVRIALIGWAFVLAVGSAATLHGGVSAAPGTYTLHKPPRGIWQHPPYFHDGSAADLLAVVNHYDALFGLNLSAQQKADLVEFLKSL
jgi:cytochrome c peroxidase